jgi:drug/metabolite transporter (DMT)-like permease
MILVKSLLSGLAFLFVMISLERNPISTALPLLGLTPAITALTAMLLLGEMLHAWEWFGLALMMAGIYILESRPSENLMQPLRTLAVSRRHRFIYAALLLFAVSSTIDKLLVSGYKIDPWAILFYQHIIYCIVFGTFLIVRKKSFGPMIRAASSQWAFIVVVAILTIAYRFTQLKATALAPVALVLAVKRTSIVYASFFGGKLFSDERLGRKIVGAVLIVAAGFIILRNVG